MVNGFSIFLLLASLPLMALNAAESLGATRIARWEGDRQAAFMLMFDDSLLSQVANVVPVLEANHLIATFYVNPGTGQWSSKRQVWETDLPKAGMEYGNHTMTHKGFHNDAEADAEIGGCNTVISKLFPGTKLISWGQPGGINAANWSMNAEQLSTYLKAHNLIPRPDFNSRGAMIHVKTPDEMMGLVDKAVKTGGMEAIVFHGVGGDWIVTPLPIFTAFIERLAARRDQVWITGHIKAHQYATERDASTVSVDSTNAKLLKVKLSCSADANLYDQPLTLVTTVPAAWKHCLVSQGTTKTTIEVAANQVRFAALPAGGPITLANAP